MSAATADWIALAEDDLNVAEMAYEPNGRPPSYHAACYHSQQCCEKYLKAFLIENGASFPKTHDLYYLLELCLPFAEAWSTMGEELRLVFELAADVRYPGIASVTKSDAETSLEITKRLRSTVRDRISDQ